MPLRKTPLVNDETYHVFNRSIAKTSIFNSKRNSNRFLEIINYYRFENPPFRFSYFLRLSSERKQDLLKSLTDLNTSKVEILSFSIMPNHNHFVLKQTNNNGISNFIRLIQESFAKYFNLMTQRNGSVFQQSFKAVRIEDESQFINTTRYVHLNPLTGFVIKTPGDLYTYPLTSFPDYISNTPRSFVNTEPLLSFFSSKEKFIQHTLDQDDYQKNLEQITLHTPDM
ncbi:transposase [Candidatus Collierbacteria bacterium]|nr:transposase [Candidatus Collierbacteria bacterium]